jgi:hypothetical protein
MEASLAIPAPVTAVSARIPWHCKAVVLGATCILVGVMWDISWHSTNGRDTFWTPAHMMIYLGGLLGGCCSGFLVVKATFFGTAEERARSVRFWGARGPLGAWVSLWGAAAMLTSAPFDNWWHDAYGLDVKILSPPHTVLALGIYALALGAILLVLSEQNRSAPVAEGRAPAGSGLLVFAGGVLLAMATIMVTEYSWPNQQHTGTYYLVSSALYPLLLTIAARAARRPWPATTMAAIYMGLSAVMTWILPLFPAEPKLAPIYNPVTHMVPPPFPELLIVPALGIDLVMHWVGGGRGWKRDLLIVFLSGLVFVALFVPVQWWFSKFILSPAAENWFFAGQRYFTYTSAPGEWWKRFWEVDKDPLTTKTIVWSVALAWVSVQFGLWRGNWMATVKR